jgi:hypothetical protein
MAARVASQRNRGGRAPSGSSFSVIPVLFGGNLKKIAPFEICAAMTATLSLVYLDLA